MSGMVEVVGGWGKSLHPPGANRSTARGESLQCRGALENLIREAAPAEARVSGCFGTFFPVPWVETRLPPAPLARGLLFISGTARGFRTARRASVQCLCFASMALGRHASVLPSSFKSHFPSRPRRVPCKSKTHSSPPLLRPSPQSFFQPARWPCSVLLPCPPMLNRLCG